MLVWAPSAIATTADMAATAIYAPSANVTAILATATGCKTSTAAILIIVFVFCCNSAVLM